MARLREEEIDKIRDSLYSIKSHLSFFRSTEEELLQLFCDLSVGDKNHPEENTLYAKMSKTQIYRKSERWYLLSLVTVFNFFSRFGNPEECWNYYVEVKPSFNEEIRFLFKYYSYGGWKFIQPSQTALSEIKERLSSNPKFKPFFECLIYSMLMSIKKGNSFIREDCPEMMRCINYFYTPEECKNLIEYFSDYD